MSIINADCCLYNHNQLFGYQIEVADARQKVVKYGALRVGSTLKKVVPIVNNSLAPVTFRLSLNPTSAALQESGVVKFMPTEDITLQPKGGTAKVEVTISPKTRITQFTEEVWFIQILYQLSIMKQKNSAIHCIIFEDPHYLL